MFCVLTWTDKQGVGITELPDAITGQYCLVYT